MEKGHVIRVSPDAGEEIGEKSKLTLTVSRGTCYVVKDYRHRLPEEVEKELSKENPNHQTRDQLTSKGRIRGPDISEQSGLKWR